jgi:hypothetical protein
VTRAPVTGHLGRAPELRQADPRAHFHGKAPQPLRRDGRSALRGPRPASRLHAGSLAHRTHPAAKAMWHRGVVWSGHLLAYRAIRWAHQGDLVRITGWPEGLPLLGRQRDPLQPVPDRHKGAGAQPQAPGTRVPLAPLGATPCSWGSGLPRSGLPARQASRWVTDDRTEKVETLRRRENDRTDGDARGGPPGSPPRAG